MILKNLFRRKGRTLLTMLGISIGVAAIIILGALAEGLDSGYNSMLTGSQADLVLSQPDTVDISMSSVDEEIGEQLMAMSEISAVSGMLESFVQTEDTPYLFIFGYPENSFLLERFQIDEGAPLYSYEAQKVRGKPLLLGSAAADAYNKEVGDTMRLSGTAFRIVGIYTTGSALEDGGAAVRLEDAQTLLGKQHQVSIFYIQLKDRGLRDRVQSRVERLWPDLSLSTSSEFADNQIMGDMMNAYVWVIAGLAIVIGGVSTANAQLMSVYERTREIGVLRAVGWSSRRVLILILGESVVVGLLGGVLGVGLGWLGLAGLTDVLQPFGANVDTINAGLLSQAFIVVIILGLVGGIFPARRAAALEPIEALRYEGGSGGDKQKRLPIGGMAVQSLWQRTTRTLLTLGAISITVGGIMALEGMVGGVTDMIGDLALGNGSEIMLRQANIADTSLSAIDERIASKIEALPEVDSVSGMMFTGVTLPETTFFIMFGYAPGEFAIRKFNIVEGAPLRSNREIILGSQAAEALKKGPGESLELGGSRFKIVGIYESGTGWEEIGGVITLRDAQTFVGRPRKLMMATVKLIDSNQAEEVVNKINTQFPDIHAALSGEFAEQMPDMEAMDAMLASISFMAIVVGGAGIMNTMLMAVLERTREIGTLRALGWRQRAIINLILKEALLLGFLGGVLGVFVAFGLVALVQLAPYYREMISPIWSLEVFVRAFIVAMFLGLLGGIYPAFRATRMQPVEALRYE